MPRFYTDPTDSQRPENVAAHRAYEAAIASGKSHREAFRAAQEAAARLVRSQHAYSEKVEQ